jgi:hypothetical protein
MLPQWQEHLTDASKPHFNSFFTDTKASKRIRAVNPMVPTPV